MNREFDPDFHMIMLGFRWGLITPRPGLDPRTRQLCTFATFLTIGEYEETHIDHQIAACLRCGASRQEVVEVILQTGLFAGIHKWGVRKRAMKIFAEMGYHRGVNWGPSGATPTEQPRILGD